MNLRTTIDAVRAHLREAPALGPYAGRGVADYRRYRAEVEAFAATISRTLDARIVDRPTGASVALVGIRSSSTSGIIGALRNWCAAAERKLAQAGSEDAA